VTGETLEREQINLVKDVAALTPGLNISSDAVGRAFLAIRGVGNTLIDTVQPGVGIFIDGIYQPNTSYLNSPVVDVERIEVLRGPQGTLFGNNTLGGAINVVTRAPTDHFEGRATASYAGPDNYQTIAGSISGPIIAGTLRGRLAGNYHSQDGFSTNLLVGGDARPLETEAINGSIICLRQSVGPDRLRRRRASEREQHRPVRLLGRQRQVDGRPGPEHHPDRHPGL
jgi:iron complex outermembrane receptor protein